MRRSYPWFSTRPLCNQQDWLCVDIFLALILDHTMHCHENTLYDPFKLFDFYLTLSTCTERTKSVPVSVASRARWRTGTVGRRWWPPHPLRCQQHCTRPSWNPPGWHIWRFLGRNGFCKEVCEMKYFDNCIQTHISESVGNRSLTMPKFARSPASTA